MRKLFVIIPDRLSTLVSKGEMTPRYYNPGNLFDEVHILLTNDDTVDLKEVPGAAGRARVYVHHLPSDNKTFAPAQHVP